jgi:sulfate permease, SulP family
LQLAGVPPAYGIYTGFPAVVYTLLGGSKQAAVGPMSLVALLLSSGLTSLDPPPSPSEYAGAVMAITFFAGAIMLAMGALNLGFIVRFISRPVLAGFSSASAILTIAATAKDLLGTTIPRAQVPARHRVPT